MDLRGSFTALITPFCGETIDEEGFVYNIKRQLDGGSRGVVVMGSTGESATLFDEEKKRLVQLAVQEAKGKMMVIAGTGCNSTSRTILQTLQAEKLGADAALVVTPYYNRPTQEGIYRHFKAISEACSLPLIVYNVASRTGTNIETSTLLRIADLPTVVGVKEASGNMLQVMEVVQSVKSRHPDFQVLSGDDILTLPMISVGACGAISILGNLLPAEMSALVKAALSCDFTAAKEIHFCLHPLFKLETVEVNPIPIKEMMRLMNFPSGLCRLPLCELLEENRERVKKQLIQMKLIRPLE
ncbi:MAG: 4-hydroxy-tetrahydrodipicolinate synthase [Anaerolineae bacterium]